MVPAAVAVAITAEVPCFQISDLHQTYARMCAVLRVLPTSICRYVTLDALRPRHLSRPLACVCAGELPCGCFELNRSTLHCYSANAALPWHDSSFFILHVYGHHYAVMPTRGWLFDRFLYGNSELGCFLARDRKRVKWKYWKGDST